MNADASLEVDSLATKKVKTSSRDMLLLLESLTSAPTLQIPLQFSEIQPKTIWK